MTPRSPEEISAIKAAHADNGASIGDCPLRGTSRCSKACEKKFSDNLRANANTDPAQAIGLTA